MSTEEMNRKIAEACGWKRAPKYDHATAILDKVEIWQKGETLKPHYKMPDYCNDLNACHEMENALTDDERLDYIDNLLRIQSHEKSLPIALTFAPAQQKAEAFLRTISPSEKQLTEGL